MFFKILLNYIFGYLNIRIESYFIERFINICISKRIFLWDMKREKTSILYTNIGIKDYRKLRKVAKKTKSHIKIENRKGLPFIINRYRKRKIFFLLFIIIIIGLIVTSNFIWNIEIKGNYKISREDIINSLNENGLNIGSNKNKIDINQIINNIRLKRNDISWIGINIKGTNAIIEIKESDQAPKIIDENEYCNIVSEKNALITKINVQNGTAAVKVGDIVKPGDIMVFGHLEGKYTGIRYVHSSADIEAKVWYTKKEKFYLNQEIQVPTGATEEKYTLNLNNFKINFYKTLSKFKNYDTINESKKIILFSNFYLPIEIIKTTNYEYDKQQKTYTEDELVKIATEKMENEFNNEFQNHDNIINKQVNVYPNEEYIEVEIIYEVLENIGSKEKIIF